MPSGHRTARSFALLLALGALAGTANAAPPERILFPVVGPVTYTNDFGAPRGSGSHRGNDLMAARGAPVVAVEAGRIEKPSWSNRDCALVLEGKSGTDYWYLHLNDDLTKRDDNRGRSCRNGVAYAPGLRSGQRVRAGQLIGYAGNSGNAAGIATHLHFELHVNGSRAVSPYRWLRDAPRLLYAVPASVDRVQLALSGTLRTMDDGLSLAVTRVATLGGHHGPAVRRGVTLALGPGVVVERRAGSGKISLSGAAAAKPGERVTVWTTPFAPTLATQRARPNVLSAQTIRLRGRPR